MVELLLPVDGIEADVQVVTTKGADGKERPVAIKIQPKYHSAKSPAMVAHVVASTAKGEVLQRALLRQSATTGKLTLLDQTEAVTPEFDKPKQKSKENQHGSA